MTTIGEILKIDPICTISSEVECYCTDLLEDYASTIETGDQLLEDKDIFDSVWGTIGLSKAEVAVLDSPLLQRLRHIKQLGLSSYVYCSSDYSRFSHTLGVLEIAGRMARAVSQKIKFDPDELYNFTEIVRLAAIFHDSGHMFLSHASERLLSGQLGFSQSNVLASRQKLIKEAITRFNNETSSRASLHEIIGVMIVNTAAVKDLLWSLRGLLDSKIESRDRLDQYVEYISCLIIGCPVDRSIVPFSSIINGPFDADKLDYLSRDSKCTGVPIAVDIPRLVAKITVISYPREKFNRPNIWHDTESMSHDLRIMGLKHSAQQIFWQLTMAKTTLHESIYYHQKVLTAESMFREGIDKILGSLPETELSFDKLLSRTDSFWEECYQFVLRAEQGYETQFEQGVDILDRLLTRRLFKRIAAFGQDTIAGAQWVVDDFKSHVIEEPFSKDASGFLASIAQEYNTIKQTLDELPNKKRPWFLFVRAKTNVDLTPQVGQTPIEYGEHYLMASEIFKTEPWLTGRENRLNEHYLVTDECNKIHVFLALEKALYGYPDGRMTLDPSSYVCAKINDSRVNAIKNELSNRGYYDSALELIAPLLIGGGGSENNGMPISKTSLFVSVCKKYATFHGANDVKVNEKTLEQFLMQFLLLPCTKKDTMLVIDGVLRMLDQALYIDRAFVRDAMSTMLERLRDDGVLNGLIVTLGSGQDSATHDAYYLNDVLTHSTTFKPLQGSIDEGLANIDEASCLIFFDDGSYSGKQCIAIFQEMMGIGEEERIIRESHGVELCEASRSVLQNSSIVLLFMCFNPQAENLIKQELWKLGLKKVSIHCAHRLDRKIFDDSALFETADQCRIVKESLSNIGKELIASTKKNASGCFIEGWNEKRAEESSLGYNDAQQIVILERSVPTYTLPVLWTSGTYRGKTWNGLFSRTSKTLNRIK